jgi:hypothetical protein
MAATCTPPSDRVSGTWAKKRETALAEVNTTQE